MASHEPLSTTRAAGLDSKPETVQATKSQPQQRKFTAEEFQVFNRLAFIMDRFHSHFRQTWNMLYRTCETGKRPAGMSIRTFLQQGLSLCQHIEIHHQIEETQLYPTLAVRMPMFKAEEHLIGQHAEIHKGLETLQEYLEKCMYGETELRLADMKAIMDSFGKVLWSHLDDEVRDLSPHNMAAYWTKEEVAAMPW